MTASHPAGGPDAAWLDMSRYPDTDPDTVLSGDEQGLLTSALAVDDGALPDVVWEHMLAVVTGEAGDDPTADDPADDRADPADDPADDPAAWSAEPALDEHGHDEHGHDEHGHDEHGHDDPGAHDTLDAHEGWDDGAGDGGAV